MGQLPYSTFAFIAITLVCSGVYYTAVRSGFRRRTAGIVLALSAVSSLIGARLLYVLTNLDAYRADGTEWWDIGFHGFSLYGGILLALGSGWIGARLMKSDAVGLADITAPFIGIGIAVMRIGCFLHGCCFGKETSLPWGVRFPLLSPAHVYQLQHPGGNILTVRPVHPTQLYELAAVLTGSLIAVFLLKRHVPKGVPFLAFGIWFTAFRFFNHFLRQPLSPADASPYFYPVFYGIILFGGMYALIRKILL